MSTNHDATPTEPHDGAPDASVKPVELPPINRAPLEDESNAAYVKYTPGLDHEPIFGDLLPDSAPVKRRSSFIDRERPREGQGVTNEDYLAATPGLEREVKDAPGPDAASHTHREQAAPAVPIDAITVDDEAVARRAEVARKQVAERAADEARREREHAERLVEPIEAWADTAKPRRARTGWAMLALVLSVLALAAAVLVGLGLVRELPVLTQSWIGIGAGTLAVLGGLIALRSRPRGVALAAIVLGAVGAIASALFGFGILAFPITA